MAGVSPDTYQLPSVFGYPQHDISKKRSPAYTIGERTHSMGPLSSPALNTFRERARHRDRSLFERVGMGQPEALYPYGYRQRKRSATPSNRYDLHGNRLTSMSNRNPAPGYNHGYNIHGRADSRSRNLSPNVNRGYDLRGNRISAPSTARIPIAASERPRILRDPIERRYPSRSTESVKERTQIYYDD